VSANGLSMSIERPPVNENCDAMIAELIDGVFGSSELGNETVALDRFATFVPYEPGAN
jgi:hypothetical protein